MDFTLVDMPDCPSPVYVESDTVELLEPFTLTTYKLGMYRYLKME
jgi:hypothetical protein